MSPIYPINVKLSKALQRSLQAAGNRSSPVASNVWGQEIRDVVGQAILPGGFPCDQCGNCAEACPVDAIEKDNGAYLIDANACIGCDKCVEACPYGVMYDHPSQESPIKCTLCQACVEICPCNALLITE
jgi:ferredoxin